MKNTKTVVNVMSRYANSMKGKTYDIQKVLRKLPKGFDGVEVIFKASSNGFMKFDKPVLCIDGHSFEISDESKPVYHCAKKIRFDLRDLNAAKIEKALMKAVKLDSNVYAPGIGTEIKIGKNQTIFNVKMNIFGMDFEEKVVFN